MTLRQCLLVLLPLLLIISGDEILSEERNENNVLFNQEEPTNNIKRNDAPPEKVHLKIGMIMHFQRWPQIGIPAFNQTVALAQKIMNEDPFYQNTNITITSLDDEMNSRLSISNAKSLISTGHVAIIGSMISAVTENLAIYVSSRKYPICTGRSSADTLSNQNIYSYFFRTCPPDNFQAEAIFSFLQENEWQFVAVLASYDAYGISLANSFLNLTEKVVDRRIQVIRLNFFNPGNVTLDKVLTVKESGAKIIVIFALPEDDLQIMNYAESLGMVNEQYVFIASDDLQTYTRKNQEDQIKYFKGRIFTEPSELKHEDNLSDLSNGLYSNFYSDCLLLLLHGYKELVKSDPSVTLEDIAQGKYRDRLDSKYFTSLSILGSSGFIEYSGGNRKGSFNFFNVRKDGSLQIIGSSIDGKFVFDESKQTEYYGDNKPSDGEIFSIEFNRLNGAIITTIGVLSLFIHISLIFLLALKRKDQSIKASFVVYILILLGGCLGSLSVFLFVGRLNDSMCIMRPWIISADFILTIGVMVVRVWEIYLDFEASEFKNQKKFFKKSKSEWLGYLVAIALVLVEIITLIIWTSIDPQRVELIFEKGVVYEKCANPTEDEIISDTFTPYIIVIAVVDFFAIAIGVVVSHLNRHINSSFNESQTYSRCIILFNIVCVILIPIIISEQVRIIAKHVITSLAIVIINLIFSFIIFSSKIRTLYFTSPKK